jgi:hypothetical protein
LTLAPAAPVREPPLGKPDLLGRRLLGFLREALEREEDLASASFRSEQDSVRLAVAVGSRFVDLAAKMTRRRKSDIPHVPHRRDDGRGVGIGERPSMKSLIGLRPAPVR